MNSTAITHTTPFVTWWRALNIALVAQCEPEATLGEARAIYDEVMARIRAW